MQLGFVSAILPDRNLKQVLEFASAEKFQCVELMCWPVGRAERKYAGVTHIDVSGFTRTQADDVVAVDRWLRTIDPGLEGVPEVTQYAGGASNWTYRLRYRNRDLVLRRPPAGTKARTAHDVAREFHIQRALRSALPTRLTAPRISEFRFRSSMSRTALLQRK